MLVFGSLVEWQVQFHEASLPAKNMDCPVMGAAAVGHEGPVWRVDSLEKVAMLLSWKCVFGMVTGQT